MDYPAERRPWIAFVLAVDGLVSVGVGAWMIVEGVSGRGPAIFALGGLVIWVGFGLAAWVLLGARYEIDGDVLVLRSGPLRRRIAISSIDEVFPTKKNQLSPAWAQARLQILFRPGERATTAFVAPADPAAFLQGLAIADPGLHLTGDRLARGV